MFVDRNGVSFEKHQAASNLLHLSEYLSYNENRTVIAVVNIILIIIIIIIIIIVIIVAIKSFIFLRHQG